MASGGDNIIKPDIFLKDFYLANLDKICKKYNHEFTSSDVVDIDSLRICEDNGFLTNRTDHWKFGKRITSVLPRLGNFSIDEDISKRSSGEETIGSSTSSATSDEESIDSIWESSEDDSKSVESDNIFSLKDLTSEDNVDVFTMHQKKINNLDRYFKSIEEYVCKIDEDSDINTNLEKVTIKDQALHDNSSSSSNDDWSLNLEIASTFSFSSKETSEESAYKSMTSSMRSRKRKLTLRDIKTDNLDDFVSVKQYDILNKYFNSVENFMDIEEPAEKRLFKANFEPRHLPP
ncbi:DgyrCDS9999 [Dimorphilus gyrociliatus]|uniref:DgyrCDS9999 n=1 Tax=Dimorphilus gyrociliatus TaxID=2664684 RepID=A0A7I8W017_9ANNE|nr:DgyrCDS9999 [Dimorphilus gyrociliatus]